MEKNTKMVYPVIDDEYERSNIASQKELGRISGNINLNHTT